MYNSVIRGNINQQLTSVYTDYTTQNKYALVL